MVPQRVMLESAAAATVEVVELEVSPPPVTMQVHDTALAATPSAVASGPSAEVEASSSRGLRVRCLLRWWLGTRFLSPERLGLDPSPC
jgi:hypothetical protein